MSPKPFPPASIPSRWSPEKSAVDSLHPTEKTRSGFHQTYCLPLVLMLLLLPGVVMAGAAIPDADGKVGRIVDRHAGGDMNKLWRGASELETRRPHDMVSEL